MPSFIMLRTLVVFAVSASFYAAKPQTPGPKALSGSDWPGIRAEYERHRQAAFPVEGGYKARNYGQRWVTRFDGHGFEVTPDAASWRWGLELRSYGFPGQEHGVDQAHGQSDVERLSYQRDSTIKEWFVNGTAGLEHGFTLASRPGDSSLPLTLHLAIRGTLTPKISPDGSWVSFLDERGVAALNYAGLKVMDARGSQLAARFTREPQGLRLEVNDRGASYPITIDPIAQQAYLKPSLVGSTQAGDNFGWSVAVSGDTVVVGAPQEDSSSTGINGTPDELAPGAGAAYVFTRTAGVWSQEAYLKPAAVGSSQAGDNFGWSVAVSGDTIAVGAIKEDGASLGVNSAPDEGATDAGAVYVFIRTAGLWTQQAYLKPAAVGATQAGDEFGYSVALSGDTLVVGSFGESSSTTGINSAADELAPGAGAAYVFTRTAGVWSQEAYLKPAAVGTTQANDHFGNSVAVSGDMVVVGSFGESSSSLGVNSTPNEGASGAGAAYVFTRGAEGWSQEAYLKPSAVGTTQANDHFGSSVAVSGDTVVVGAYGESSSSLGVNSTPNAEASGAGAAYVFSRSADGWSQEAYLKPAAVGSSQTGDFFGWSVAVSGDTVVAGAKGEDSSTMGVNSSPNEAAISAGAAYVFTRSYGVWTQQAYLKPAAVGTTQVNDQFGYSVAVSGDAVVVGAAQEASSSLGVNSTPNEGAAGAGAAYVFTIPPPQPALSVTSTHRGNFLRGQRATYSLTVSNAAGGGPTIGTVQVTNELPPGLSLVSMAGKGWTCDSGGSCTRFDPLNGGGSYDLVTVTANVAPNAMPTVINRVAVSGGGSPGAKALDVTTTATICDINLDGSTNVSDVVGIINEVRGIGSAVHDLNNDNSVNVVDVQQVINGAFGLTCPAVPSAGPIGLPSGVIVALGGTANFPVTLPAAAPAGGVTVTLTSADTSKVTVTPGTVSIAAGQTTPASQPVVHGIDVGSASISASAPGYTTSSQSATVAASVSWPQSTFTFTSLGTQNVALTLSAAAPANGLTVNLSSSTQAVATVPATATFAAGSTSVNVPVTALAVGSTVLHASGTNIPDSTATLTVTTPVSPTITVSNVTVGANLQAQILVTLSTPVTGGPLDVSLTSSDGGKLIIGSLVVLGTTSKTLTFPVNTNSGIAYVQALAGSGTVTVTASAVGYTSGSGTVTLTPSGFVITGPAGTVGVPSFPTNVGNTTTLTVMTGRLDPALNYVESQGLRGGFSVAVPLSSSLGTVGNVSPASVTFTPADTAYTTTFTALGVGTTLVSASEPSGFSTPAGGANAITANVSAGGVTAPNVTVGQSLEVAAQVTLTGAPSSPAVLTLTSSDSNRLRFGISATDPGVGTIPIPSCVPPSPDPTNACKIIKINAGQSHSADIYFQALASTGSATYTANVAGFGTSTGTVTFTPSGIVIAGPSGLGNDFSTVTGSANSVLTVESARLDSSRNFVELQPVAPVSGVQPISVNVTSSNTGVGTITASAVPIAPGSGSATTGFHAVSAGSTAVSVDVPTGFSTPAQFGSVGVTVSTAGIAITEGISLGKFLQVQGNFALGAAVAPGTIVTFTSNSPSLLLISSSPTVAGSVSLGIASANGTNGTYYLQGLASSGTASYTVSATGFAPHTGSITLTPSGIVLGDGTNPGALVFGNRVVVSMAQLDTFGNFGQVQQLAGGSSPVSINMSTNVSGATITTPVTITAGNDSTNATLTGSGTGTVSGATPPGFTDSNFLSVPISVF